MKKAMLLGQESEFDIGLPINDIISNHDKIYVDTDDKL